MKTVYFVTRLRGFFRQLINSTLINAKIIYNDDQVYETNTFLTKLKNKVGRSFLFDKLGIIQVIRDSSENTDIVGSFNRFIRTAKPYFIYVENPTALFHYRLGRRNSYKGKRKIQRELNSPQLKALVFMSKACESTFETVCGKIPSTCYKETIYPLIPENPYVNIDKIHKRCNDTELKVLYIAQGIRFESKGGLEVIKAVEQCRRDGRNITLHIITSLKDTSVLAKESYTNKSGIIVDDFKFSFKELQQIYAENHILLQPTSDDSFGLTILEAMKSGLPIIASKLYSIPEIVTENWNGFLCDPQYWFFDKQKIPNPIVWNNRKSTIYSGHIDESIVEFLKEKITFLYENRDVLTEMSINSFNRANHPPLSEAYIARQWNALFDSL